MYITDSPGFLLMSDNNGIFYYFTLSANVEATGTVGTIVDDRLIQAEGITGKVYIYNNCEYIEGSATNHMYRLLFR